MHKTNHSFIYALSGVFEGAGVVLAILENEWLRYLGIGVACLALLFFLYMSWKDSYRGQFDTLKNLLEKHKDVWALWHNGEDSLGDQIFYQYSPIKKLLLFDPSNNEYMAQFIERSPDGYTKEQAKNSIRTVCEKSLNCDIPVKLYLKPSMYSITIFDKEYNNGFSNKAWMYYQSFIPKSSKKERPIIIIKKSKNPDSFDYLVREYNKIFDSLPLLTKGIFKEKFG
jgi:hypothetical protein